MRANAVDAEVYLESLGKGLPIRVVHGGLGLDHAYFRTWLDKFIAPASAWLGRLSSR